MESFVSSTVDAWLVDLTQTCQDQASHGARRCEWTSSDLWGCSKGTSAELLRRLSERLCSLGFSKVEWWHGLHLGWHERMPRALGGGRASLETCSTSSTPCSWGMSVRLRVAWGGQVGSDGGKPPCRLCGDRSTRRSLLEPCGHELCRLCARRVRGRPCGECGVLCRAIVDVPSGPCPGPEDEGQEQVAATLLGPRPSLSRPLASYDLPDLPAWGLRSSSSPRYALRDYLPSGTAVTPARPR